MVMGGAWIFLILKYGFGGIGIIFICVAIGLIISNKRKRGVCTQPVPAVVVNIERMDSTSTDGIRMVSWFPIFEYWYGGISIQKRSSMGSAHQDFYIGQRVQLYLNPQNPNEFYCPLEKRGVLQGTFLGVGCVLVVIAVLITVLFGI